MIALYVLGYLLVGLMLLCGTWTITVLAARLRRDDDPDPEKNLEMFLWILFGWPVLVPLAFLFSVFALFVFGITQALIWTMNKIAAILP